MKKIYITGCAKSGTTLLKRMFHAFRSTWVVEQETSLYDFIRLKKQHVGDFDIVVAKRNWSSILSCSILRGQERINQWMALKDNDIDVINIVRDGRSVVDSFWRDYQINGSFEWMDCAAQALEYDADCLNIRFEDLINTPDQVQMQIVKRFKLFRSARLSKYPSFIPSAYHDPDQVQYKLRPIDVTRASNYSDLWQKIKPNDIEHFTGLLNKWNYAT